MKKIYAVSIYDRLEEKCHAVKIESESPDIKDIIHSATKLILNEPELTQEYCDANPHIVADYIVVSIYETNAFNLVSGE